MKTKTINLYKFKELSPEAQQKAIYNLVDINVSHNWWEDPPIDKVDAVITVLPIYLIRFK